MIPTKDSTGADGGPSDDDSSRSEVRSVRWVVLGAVAVVVVVAIVSVLWLAAGESEEFAEPLDEVGPSWAEIAQQVPSDPGRRYSDVELGLYDLIDEAVYYRPYYARFRTPDDYFADYRARRHSIPTEVEGHERERLQFEIDIEDALARSYHYLPADLGPGGLLEQAYDDWMSDCAAEAGFAGVELADKSAAELGRYESEFGLSADEFYELRYDCARQAAHYPTLDPGVRDEMVGRLKQHYLQDLHDFIRFSGVVEIPVDHHEGAPRPLEDSYLRHCLEFDVAGRGACADYYRIELTEEQKTAPATPLAAAPDVSAPFVAVSNGWGHWCALNHDGLIECWGENEFERTDAPAGEFVAVAVGGMHSCALDHDGLIECWGRNDFGQADALWGEFVAVTAGGLHSCGLRGDGTVACWGDRHMERTAGPASKFVAVSGGGRHTCALDDAGLIDCWGENEFGQTDAPAGEFTAVSAGWEHSCALNDGRGIVCWGRNDFGQTDAPAGEFVAVSAGWEHSCALSRAHLVECWGRNDFREADAPARGFIAVSAGYEHSCALNPAGQIKCWGRDNSDR